MIYKVGITGGIGSGKTLVCKIFETLGVAVYYADEAARRMMSEDEIIIEKLKRILGENAYEGNQLNRGYIASVIFNNSEILREINQIVHPAVQEDFRKWTGQVTGSPYVIEEAAILYESGASAYLDTIVLVYASEKTRLQRVMERDGVGEDLIRERMRNQISEEEKKRLADHVIMNDNNILLLPQVVKLHQEFLNNLAK